MISSNVIKKTLFWWNFQLFLQYLFIYKYFIGLYTISMDYNQLFEYKFPINPMK